MNSKRIYLIVLLAALLSNPLNAHAATDFCPPRLVVLPFENSSGRPSQRYLSLGLAALVAEKLEAEPAFETVTGPLILTRDQARLVPDSGAAWDRTRAARHAAEAGASYVLAGSYNGDPEHWTVTASLYRVGPERLELLSSGTSSGTQIEIFQGRSGQKLARVSLANIQRMLAEAAVTAFRQAHIGLSAATVKSLNETPTDDAYAYILYSRALGKLFLEGVEKPKAGTKPPTGDATALGAAEHAVRVDPKFQEARRLYAALLAAIGTPKSLDRARLHYEEALKVKPDDLRSLLALGQLEVATRDYDAAEDLLKRATQLKPEDPEPHYWYGKDLLGLERRPEARNQFELARKISGSHLAARRELVSLYAAERRYLDAAKELLAVTAQDRADATAAFQLAACYRAAGQFQDAADAYGKGAERFGTKDYRFLKFQGDMLARLGREEAAGRMYLTAAALNPKDPRLVAIMTARKGSAPLPQSLLIGGQALLQTVSDGTELSETVETRRAEFQDAANDAVLDAVSGKEGCHLAAASAGLAKRLLSDYAAEARRLNDGTDTLRIARSAGEDAALTPDEAQAASAAIAYETKAERDWREMSSLYRRSVMTALARARCPERTSGPEAVLADVRRRNQERIVALPEVKPPRWRPPASPDIPSDPARIVTFAVTNRSVRSYSMTLDGDTEHLTPVPPRGRRTFTARIGYHRLCLQPSGLPCNEQSDLSVTLHEGWEIVIQPGKSKKK